MYYLTELKVLYNCVSGASDIPSNTYTIELHSILPSVISLHAILGKLLEILYKEDLHDKQISYELPI